MINESENNEKLSENKDENLKKLLDVRKKINKKRPVFIRQESWRYKRVGESWRRPRGKDSKMRLGKKGRPKLVKVGYRSPKKVRGFNSSGVQEFIVYNIMDLSKVLKGHSVVIAKNVGSKKRLDIIRKAMEQNIKITNYRGIV